MGDPVRAVSLSPMLGRVFRTLTTRLTVAFAAVALLTAGLSAIILSAVWAQLFDQYVRDGLQSTAVGAAHIIGKYYERDGGWSVHAFSQMPRFGIMSGLGLHVLNEENFVIYDDSVAGELMGGVVSFPQATGGMPREPVV
ncbi:MAG: hypothetical protein KGZ40_06800, partial [Clostridiales bacterium]|nr:hypothetical protein [Clostridiales bacterium]